MCPVLFLWGHLFFDSYGSVGKIATEGCWVHSGPCDARRAKSQDKNPNDIKALGGLPV